MAARPTSAERTAVRPQARLYVVTPPLTETAGFAAGLAQLLEAADVAAVLVPLPRDSENALIKRVKALAPLVQNGNAALLIEDHANLVGSAGADGAHLTSADGLLDAVETLKPDRIAGCGGLHTRHDAMRAGEAGADYAMFGEPDAHGHRPGFDAILDRVEWWAEVFEIPCVAFAGDLDEIGPLVRAGADFVAVGDWLWSDPRGAATALADAAQRLTGDEIAR